MLWNKVDRGGAAGVVGAIWRLRVQGLPGEDERGPGNVLRRCGGADEEVSLKKGRL